MDGTINGLIDGLINWWMNRQPDGQTGGFMDEWTDRKTNDHTPQHTSTKAWARQQCVIPVRKNMDILNGFIEYQERSPHGHFSEHQVLANITCMSSPSCTCLTLTWNKKMKNFMRLHMMYWYDKGIYDVLKNVLDHRHHQPSKHTVYFPRKVSVLFLRSQLVVEIPILQYVQY